VPKNVIRAAIIAGGGARRFGGGPKGLAAVGGARILDRLVAACRDALGADPLLVANAADATTWHPGLRGVPDLRPDTGALGGLYTAVVEAPAPVVCVAWDMPFVTAPLLRSLAGGLAEADAVLPASGGRRGVEPLCAAYGPACRAPMAAALDLGDLRAIAFHAAVRTCILSGDEIRALGVPDHVFFNVNTPEDLTEAERLWRAHESSRSSGGRTPERPR
jgi:molybdopterin-guanine dinucleotide biosynthesis protein A